jgi:bifunctional DNA-binding transcriptional regulator/antitoxin component of YhaV-PrlF toxin-antitoxin module
MRYRLKKSDNDISLPKKIIDKLGMKEDDEVIADIRDNEVIIRPKIRIVDKLLGIASSSKSSLELHKEFNEEIEKSMR